MKRLTSISILLVALLAAGSATAAVTIYKNAFKSRSDYSAVEKLGGGQCGKSWKQKKQLGYVVGQGGTECLIATPVVGDGPQPDGAIQVVGKVGKTTDKKVRASAYVGVALRANAKSAYEVRIFPKGRQWQLLKNGERVATGREKAIDKLGAPNRIRLSADNSTIEARVNGTLLKSFKDKSADQVSGRKAALAFGSTRRSKKDAVGSFDKIKVLVPDP